MSNQNHEYIDGYIHISQSIDTTNRRLNQIRDGSLKTLRTSSKKENDKIGGLLTSDQMIVAARTGMGKTAYILNRMRDFVDKTINPDYADNLIILFDSWEMPD